MENAFSLYTNVNSVVALFVILFVFVGLLAAILLMLVLFAANDLVESFGFMRGIDSVLNDWRNSLRSRNGFRCELLRNSVRDNRGRYGRNLHMYGSCELVPATDYYTTVINKHLIISCKRF